MSQYMYQMSVFVQILLLLSLHVLSCYLFPISARSGSEDSKAFLFIFHVETTVKSAEWAMWQNINQILNAFFSQFILVRLPAQSMLLLLLLHLLPYNRQTEATQLLQQYLFSENVVSHVHSTFHTAGPMQYFYADVLQLPKSL